MRHFNIKKRVMNELDDGSRCHPRTVVSFLSFHFLLLAKPLREEEKEEEEEEEEDGGL